MTDHATLTRFKEALSRAEHLVNTQGWHLAPRPTLWEVTLTDKAATVSQRCELSLPLTDSLCGLGVGAGVQAVIVVATESTKRCAHLVAIDGCELTTLRYRSSPFTTLEACRTHERETWFLRRVIGLASRAFSDKYQLDEPSPREVAQRTLATQVVTQLLAADMDSSKSVQQTALEALTNEPHGREVDALARCSSWQQARQNALDNARTQLQQANKTMSWTSRSSALADISSLLWYDDELYGQRLADETMSLQQCRQVLHRLRLSGALPATLFSQLNGMLLGSL